MSVTVWAVCVGSKYSSDDVLILKDMVARNLKAPHDFWTLTDREMPGVHSLIPHDIGKYPGWWAKTMLWRYGTKGHHLYLDLDTVVISELDGLLSEQFSASANWAQSGHGGIQSSVMAWAGDYSWLTDRFDPGLIQPDAYHPYGRYGTTDYWGDQEWLTAQLGSPGAGKVKAMKGVCSYKYHCVREGKPPEWARVVAFHGLPKSGDCRERWIVEAKKCA